MLGVLEVLEQFTGDRWRVVMTRTATGCRTWKVYHRGESSPRITFREA